MARLKRTTTTAALPATAPEPFPPHVRVPEWSGLKTGDLVNVSIPGKRRKRGVYWTFIAHVTSPKGTEYIEVHERKIGDPYGLWRSFRPDQVTPMPRKKRIA